MESLIAELLRNRAAILSEWGRRLHAEPVVSPLALPDCLEHLMGRTFDTVLARLRNRPDVEDHQPDASAETGIWPPTCHCGRNPFLAYYRCGEQAFATFQESVSLTGKGCACAAREVLREMGREEIQGFGELCRLAAGSRPPGSCPCEAKCKNAPGGQLSCP